MTIENKRGRPKLWFLPVKTVRLPEKYHQALIEIALEWQQNEYKEE
jgi:hypothetical protein